MVFNPSPAIGSWFTPTGSVSNDPRGVLPSDGPLPSSGSRPRFYSTAGGPVTLPSDWSDEDAQQWVAAYNQYIGKLEQQWQQTSGLQRRQIEAQIEDAKKARDNALEIAQMQDRTSRYGTDVASRDRMAQLQENQRQFNLSHGLEMQKLGLSRAQAATDFLSTPDRFVQAGDFLDLSGRVISGGGWEGQSVTPQMKTMSDYAALEAGGNPGRQVSGANVGGNANDPRVKVLKSLIDAAPPSAEPGMDRNAYAVLNAAKEIYGMNLTPQQQSMIRGNKQYQQMLGSAGRRLGRNPDDWWQKQQQSLPGQGAARSA